MRLKSKIKIIICLLKLSKDPDSYENIESFRKVLRAEGLSKMTMDSLRKNLEIKNFLQSRYLSDEKKIDVESLAQLSQETLGHQYAHFLKSQNLQPVFFSFKNNTVIDEETYFVRRILQTHDIWHVLLGYSTSLREEMLIQAFMFRQVHWTTAPFVIAGILFKIAFSQPFEISSYFAALSEGWQRAGQAKPLFPVIWENHWQDKVEDLRLQYQLK